VFAAAHAMASGEDMVCAVREMTHSAYGSLMPVTLPAVVECVITRPAQTRGTTANFAVSIKTEALSSGLGRTDSAWSSARHVITTRVMMVNASPAPRRAAGGRGGGGGAGRAKNGRRLLAKFYGELLALLR